MRVGGLGDLLHAYPSLQLKYRDVNGTIGAHLGFKAYASWTALRALTSHEDF